MDTETPGQRRRSRATDIAFTGFCNDALEAALPVVARWRLATIPRSLTDQQVEQVLTSFNVPTPYRQRDHAILQFLSTLGLRPGEVADLCLDDIDWRGGTVEVRTRKNRRGAVLPLPRVVGQVITSCLAAIACTVRSPRSASSATRFLKFAVYWRRRFVVIPVPPGGSGIHLSQWSEKAGPPQ